MPINLRRPGWLIAAFVLGATVGLLLLGRKPAKPLTAERLAAARATWTEEAPDSYTLELTVRGALNETHVVVVRGGEVVSMTTGDIEAPEGSWPYWSVEGLFDTLQTELGNAADPRRTFGADRIDLLARFDASRGYPTFFYRHIRGSLNDIKWEVTRFAVD
jgi:hypothetical protein